MATRAAIAPLAGTRCSGGVPGGMFRQSKAAPSSSRVRIVGSVPNDQPITSVDRLSA